MSELTLSWLVTSVVTLLVGLSGAQITRVGTCPWNQVTLVQNFNISQYLGRWYHSRHYPNPFQDGTCGTAFYSELPNGNMNVTITMRNRTCRHSNLFSERVISALMMFASDPSVLIRREGEAFRTSSSATDSKLRLTFLQGTAGSLVAVNAGDYWVLATDYENYALVWACKQHRSSDTTLTINSQMVWILGRERFLSDEGQRAVTEALRANHINTLYLTSNEHQLQCSTAVMVASFGFAWLLMSTFVLKFFNLSFFT